MGELDVQRRVLAWDRAGRACLTLVGLAALALASLPTAPSNHGHARGGRPGAGVAGELLTFDPLDAEGLARALEAAWGDAAGGEVPGLAPDSLPEDLDRLPSRERKRLFVRSVLPHVLRVNLGIAAERRRLEDALARVERREALGEDELAWLGELALRYRLEASWPPSPGCDPAPSLGALLQRVDVIPPSLALAQAALESGWGSSRFAQEGNALFGQWVFASGTGMVPQGSGPGAGFGVARFESMGAAVEAYAHNLNTFWAYEDFRTLRDAGRKAGRPADPLGLAAGLLLYSERREAYVEDVRTLIRGNRMARYDRARLAPLDRARLGQILAAEGLASSGAAGRRQPDA